MGEDTYHLSQAEAQQLWATLAAEGKAPAELIRASHLLPAYTVGVEQWVDRLARTYLQNLCRKHAHFKVVLAPYGGGKTHFLMALGSRALAEGFAAAYIPCGPGVSLDSPLDVYREFIKRLYLPGEDFPGVQRLLARVVDHKRTQIEVAAASDPDYAFDHWLAQVSRAPHPENAFGRVVAEALKGERDPSRAVAGDAAVRWLQGDIDTLTREELTYLRLAKVPAKGRTELGRNVLMSMVRFVQEAGAHGVVLLLDEVETLFTARGKALLRILSAMRVMVDLPIGIPGGVPLFGVFSAVPEIVKDALPKYPALQQRLAVLGAPFEKGNDFAAQLSLEKLRPQKRLLESIGHKLIDLGRTATSHQFNLPLQTENAARLARVADEKNLEVDARRLYVKAWVNILEAQIHDGERALSEDELAARYQGYFEQLKGLEQGDEAP